LANSNPEVFLSEFIDGRGNLEVRERQSLSEENRDELEELIRKLLAGGQLDPDAMSKLAGFAANPQLMQSLFSQARSLMEPGDEVNWELAKQQALSIAKQQAKSSSASLETELKKAFEIAQLWLAEETSFTNPSQPKLFTRELWVQDALPLFQKLGNPLASKMSKALGENLGSMLPEELQSVIGPATNFIQNAGATIFATQLGVAVGQLSSKTLSAGEIGIPIIDRPGFIVQNLEEFLDGLETPKSEILIYLAIRELAISSLYQSNRWLLDQITTQVIEFAADLRVELTGLQEMVEQLDPNDPDSINKVMEASASFNSRTPEQEVALARIETLLALIDGFVDAVSEQAAKRLPNIASLIELVNRKRATDGPAEKTFLILLGLELKPKLRREAKAMWDKVLELGTSVRDSLWAHPDQLPTIQEIQDPESLVSRLSKSGDDFDGELRKLLGD
jgi:putative hydrolase